MTKLSLSVCGWRPARSFVNTRICWGAWRVGGYQIWKRNTFIWIFVSHELFEQHEDIFDCVIIHRHPYGLDSSDPLFLSSRFYGMLKRHFMTDWLCWLCLRYISNEYCEYLVLVWLLCKLQASACNRLWTYFTCMSIHVFVQSLLFFLTKLMIQISTRN